jgi:hypothetical protein
MTAASYKLCRELHKLSGWTDTAHWCSQIYVAVGPHDTPAYELTYLLQKLPKRIKVAGSLKGFMSLIHKNAPLDHKADDVWTAGYYDGGWSYYKQADTPEDAAALLGIELFRQGVLKPTQTS